MFFTPSRPTLSHPVASLNRALLALLFLILPLILPLAMRPVTLTPVLPARRQAASAPPAGLTTADWHAVRRLIAPSGYHPVAAADGFNAVNPRQGWYISFAPNGSVGLQPDQSVAWRWGLRLTAIGYSAPQALTHPTHLSASGPEVHYTWSDELTEWWVNRPDGLEQGFTLTRRPAGYDGHSPLRLWLAPQGDLQPVLAEDAVHFVDGAGHPVLHYHTLRAWDATGRAVAGRIELHNGQLTLTLDDAAASYPLTIDPTVQTAYLKAANAGASDEFAFAVATSGDTIVVGARFEDSGNPANPNDNSAQDTGAIYVFTRSGASWTQQAYLKAAIRDPGDDFGFAVAIDGDTIVVGASGEESGTGDPNDNSRTDSGAAYVFVRNGNSWSQQAYLKPGNPDVSDLAGRSVAISGNTIVVGAYNEDSNGSSPNDNSASNAGAAYVFVRNGTSWSQQAYLKATNAGTGDEFGRSVAIVGDTIVVGAPYEDSASAADPGNNSFTDAGAAYVFTRSGSNWTQRAYLKAGNVTPGAEFGYAVALDGNSLVIGAPGENGTGAAYVFTGSGPSWTPQASFTAANADNLDYFGAFVALSGDILAVGAPGEDSASASMPNDNSRTDSGAAYVFTRSGSSWTQRAYLKADNAGADDLFGTSVAIAGNTLVVGAPYEDNSTTPNESATNAGAAYVFLSDDIQPGVTVEQAAGQADPATAGPIRFTASFSEPINAGTFTADDVILGGTAGGPLSASITPIDASTFTITVSGMRSAGTVTASIPAGAVTDPLGNPNTASTSNDNTVTYAPPPPAILSVTVEQAAGQADPATDGPIQFTASFSAPINASTFTADDVTLGGTAGGPLSASITPIDASTFTIAVSGMRSAGTVTASIPASAVTDPLGNPNTASTSNDNTVTYAPPSPSVPVTVTVEQAAGQADPATAGPILFIASFSAPINADTFTANDVTLGGTAGGPLSASITPIDASTFAIAVSGMRSGGTVTASIPAGAVTDPLGTPNSASTSNDNVVRFEYRVLLPLIVR